MDDGFCATLDAYAKLVGLEEGGCFLCAVQAARFGG